MNILQERAKAVIKQHGGATKAARALRINRSVLTLLADGSRAGASDKTLRALGLVRHRPEPVIESRTPLASDAPQ